MAAQEASFESLWRLRLAALLLELTAALQLVHALVADLPTIQAAAAGDAAATRELEAAFRGLTELPAKLEHLLPAPARLQPLADLVGRACRSLALAGACFNEAVEGRDLEKLSRALDLVGEGGSFLSELKP